MIQYLYIFRKMLMNKFKIESDFQNIDPWVRFNKYEINYENCNKFLVLHLDDTFMGNSYCQLRTQLS